MKLALIHYELRGLRWTALATPAGVLLGFASLAGLMHLLGAADQQVARMLVAAIEAGLPVLNGALPVQHAAAGHHSKRGHL
jgi:hypothetical protein